MNVDPFAEKYPGWTPYHYVHNNPINLIDPTGMDAEGWIESYTDDGQAMLTYDAEIDTKEQAIKKGYKNVSSVNESLYYSGHKDNESYNLNKDGSVYNNNTGSSVDVGFSPIRTGDGVYIAENSGFKQLSLALQSGGDAATYTGLALSATGVGALAGAGFAVVGEWANLTGTAIESAYLFSQGKKQEAVTKMVISGIFMGTGRLAISQTRKIAGKVAVEKGLNNAPETVVGGANTIIEKTIGADTEQMLNKKR